MKQKFISLALAVMLLLGVTGCAMSTPASVGSIGGVDIPAGIYLLAQYNAYNTASGAAKLATGETASNVKAVLKAELRKAQREERDYAAMRQNVEDFLSPPQPERERKKNVELE